MRPDREARLLRQASWHLLNSVNDVLSFHSQPPPLAFHRLLERVSAPPSGQHAVENAAERVGEHARGPLDAPRPSPCTRSQTRSAVSSEAAGSDSGAAESGLTCRVCRTSCCCTRWPPGMQRNGSGRVDHGMPASAGCGALVWGPPPARPSVAEGGPSATLRQLANAVEPAQLRSMETDVDLN